MNAIPHRITRMRKIGAYSFRSAVILLSISSLQAQEGGIDDEAFPFVDLPALEAAPPGTLPELNPNDEPLPASGLSALTSPQSINITNDGNIEFDSANETFIYNGNIIIKTDNDVTLKAQKARVQFLQATAQLTGKTSVKRQAIRDENGVLRGGIEIFADKTFLNTKTKVITLDGNVSIYEDGKIQHGDHAVYHYEEERIETTGSAGSVGPVLLESDRFEVFDRDGKKVLVGENAGITTHDVAEPNYWIRSDKTTIYPGEKITFKNLRLYAGDTPFFWLPYLSQPLDAELGYHFLPGSSSTLGPFLKNRYGIMLGGHLNEQTGERDNQWLLSRWHFDLMSQRGVGLGFDLADTRQPNSNNITGLKTYYLHDQDPTNSRTSVPREDIDENRWKFELKYQYDIAEQADSKNVSSNKYYGS